MCLPAVALVEPWSPERPQITQSGLVSFLTALTQWSCDMWVYDLQLTASTVRPPVLPAVTFQISIHFQILPIVRFDETLFLDMWRTFFNGAIDYTDVNHREK